mmetsp:Transcript_17621/g.22858  ORF Transcript_17621/g.22858 Transcript_17621/m.22858 type:complete len:98 (-) Transcript_17621:2-295(-)
MNKVIWDYVSSNVHGLEAFCRQALVQGAKIWIGRYTNPNVAVGGGGSSSSDMKRVMKRHSEQQLLLPLPPPIQLDVYCRIKKHAAPCPMSCWKLRLM